MTVFVTGGSGFVGSAVIDALLLRGCSVHALTTSGAIDKPAVRSFPGGLFDDAALSAGLAGCGAIIHLVGVIFEKRRATFERIHVEGTRRVVLAAREAGVKRVVHMSALGARPHAVAQYHQSKFEAEQLVRKYAAEWTIFRPSMIHGPRGQFIRQAAAWARGKHLPFSTMPFFARGLFGRKGSGLIQPVYVGDVATAVAACLDDRRAFDEVIPVGGPDQMSWPGMYEAISRAVVGRAVATLPIPAWMAETASRLLPVLPFNTSQVQMSREDNVCDNGKFSKLTGILPRSFGDCVLKYAAQI